MCNILNKNRGNNHFVSPDIYLCYSLLYSALFLQKNILNRIDDFPRIILLK